MSTPTLGARATTAAAPADAEAGTLLRRKELLLRGCRLLLVAFFLLFLHLFLLVDVLRILVAHRSLLAMREDKGADTHQRRAEKSRVMDAVRRS